MAAGPPQGGWGGPPGGYGGPPQGGGYGAPPGGFGPPGGYGAPPGGFGAPPGYGGPPGGFGPPPAPKSNAGLLIGLGCLGLVFVGGIAAAIVAATLTRFTEKAGEIAGSSTSGSVESPTDDTESGPLKAELRDLRYFKGNTANTQYFVGELVNTGDAPVGFPSAKLTFFDAANTALDTGSCSSLVRVLPPGEKVPCTYGIFKPIPWKTYKIEVKPMKSYFKGQLADLSITGAESRLKQGYEPHMVTGKITNDSAFKAKSVWAIASLYGADGKIVAADQGLVAGTDLEPGASGLFKIRLYNLAAEPTTFRVISIGYSE